MLLIVNPRHNILCSQVFGPEARDKAMHPQSDQEEGYFDSGESGQAVDSARACGVKDAVDAYVRSEGGWLGVTVEAQAKAWYWITSPDRFNAIFVRADSRGTASYNLLRVEAPFATVS